MPSSASATAGMTRSFHGNLPKRLCAISRPRTVPGSPTRHPGACSRRAPIVPVNASFCRLPVANELEHVLLHQADSRRVVLVFLRLRLQRRRLQNLDAVLELAGGSDDGFADADDLR